jgi:hypothetical protein
MLNLFIGYMGRGFIDNAAHLGGLVSGALLAFVVDYRRPGERSGIAITWQVLQIAAIALVAVSLVKTVQHLGDPLETQFVTPKQLSTQAPPPTEPENATYLYNVKAMNDGHEAFNTAINGNPGYIDSAITNLKNAPHLDSKSDELRERLKLLLIRAKQSKAGSPASPPDNNNPPAQGDELTKEFAAWRKEYNQWLKSNGRNHSGLSDLK